MRNSQHDITAHQLQEECQEQNKPLYTTFVDLAKAFDTMSQEDLWKIMAKLGCSHKFITMSGSSMMEWQPENSMMVTAQMPFQYQMG